MVQIHRLTLGNRTTCVTDLTTSVITVTECQGCSQPVVTVPGTTIHQEVTTELQVTYTSLCPTTETVYGPTSTYLTTRTLTSTIVTQIPTTIVQTVPGAQITHTATDIELATYTSLCPTTVVTTVGGEEVTVTYTTTVIVVTQVPTTVQETEWKGGATETTIAMEYSTVTKDVPITKVTTVSEQGAIVTKTVTSIVEVSQEHTVYETVSEGGSTKTVTQVDCETSTVERQVTKTVLVPGDAVVETVYTTTTGVYEAPISTVVVTQSTPVTSAVVVPTNGAAGNRAKYGAAVAGFLGAMLLI